VPDDADWRLRGQEGYLRGATLVRKPYHARSEEWEHDHCEFCWTKFMDPSFSSEHARHVEDHSDVLVEGYAVQGGKTIHGIKDDYWWICARCAHEFAPRFDWTIVEPGQQR
jgi:hypothetical protein